MDIPHGIKKIRNKKSYVKFLEKEVSSVSKRVAILFLLVSIMLLSSCSLLRGRVLIFDDSTDRAEARMAKIVSAINNDDKEALKSLFSKKALEEACDFDIRVDDLFDLLQNGVDSWERDGFSSDASWDYGKKSSMLRSGYKAIANEEEYFFYIVDYEVDTIDPDNEGVYMLQVTPWAESDDLGAWQDRLCAGIYKQK